MKKLLIIAVLAISALAGCTIDERVSGFNDGSRGLITFTTPVMGGVTKGGDTPDYGLVDGAIYPESEWFHVFAVQTAGNYAGTEDWSEKYMDVDVYKQGTPPKTYWAPAEEYHWPGGKLTFAAYSPAKMIPAPDGISYDGTGLKIVNFQTPEVGKQYNLMYASRVFNKDGVDYPLSGSSGAPYYGVNIAFRHALSKIVFFVKSTDSDITLTEIAITGVRDRGDFDEKVKNQAGSYVSDPTWTSDDESSADYVPFSGSQEVTGDFVQVGNSTSDPAYVANTLLMIPQTIPEAAEITIKWTYRNGGDDGTIEEDKKTFSLKDIVPEWEINKCYKYNITIALDDIYFNSVVDGWDACADVSIDMRNQTFTANGVSFEMVYVEGGTFLMGAQKDDPSGQNYDPDAEYEEEYVHQVTLTQDYWMGKYEVTQGLWEAVMGEDRDVRYYCTLEGKDPDKYALDVGDSYPMYWVSYDDICGTGGFLEQLNAALASELGEKRFVLPTEAQWEFAAAGGKAGYNEDGSRKHRYSGSDDINAVGWYKDNSYEKIHPVGQKQSNELGIYDMSGNVFEWCLDGFDEWYEPDPVTDPQNPYIDYYGRAMRSGCVWYPAKHCRVAYRSCDAPYWRWRSYGFRLALANAVTIPITGVSLSKTDLTLTVGDTYTLTAMISPNYVINKNVNWTSDIPSVVTVDNTGKVTAVGEGTANITVTTEDTHHTATCTVTVLPSLTFTVGTGADAVTFKMIYVKGGTFLMGSQSNDPNGQNYDPDAYRESPVHQVTLSDYYIGKYEVTQGLWKAVTGTDIRDWVNSDCPLYGEGDRHPMYYVAYDDICTSRSGNFLEKLNLMLAPQLGEKRFVLPTEAQWEFAAGGGNAGHKADGSRKHRYSGSDNLDDVGWYGESYDYENDKYMPGNSGDASHPVGQKEPNELGIYDMSGNVWEWCFDWFRRDYDSGPVTDPTGPETGTVRVIRDGSWDDDAVDCRVASRDDSYPGYDYAFSGFRLALSDVVPVYGVSLDKTYIGLTVGDTYTLTATVSPDNAPNKNVSWTSDDTSVATVDGTGKVTAVAIGTTTITATTVAPSYGSKTDTCTVTVIPSLTFTVGTGADAVTFEMVSVEGETFWMGAQKDDQFGQNYDSDARNNEKPVHQVTLSDYYIGKYEVTQGLWEAVMGKWPSMAPSNSYGKGDNYPAYYVSWNDICGTGGFLEKLNDTLALKLDGKRFALPTEAQWEFAARGGTKGHRMEWRYEYHGFTYSGGNIDDVAWYYGNSGNTSHPVGRKQPNELGIYDMSGNLWEWCSDWYDETYYQTCFDTGTAVEDPAGPETGTYRVLRGGYWFSNAVYCRVTFRRFGQVQGHTSDIGFRLVLLP